MTLNQENLTRIIAGQRCGEAWPYKGGTEAVIKDFLRGITNQLGASKLLETESEFNHYGSGYASYVDVFCWKRDGSSQRHEEGRTWTQGLVLYLCRLAPVFVLGWDAV